MADSDNNRESIVFRLSVPDLRKRLKLAGFRGSVRALSAIGEVPHANLLCAALFCSHRSPHEVFINTNVNCDHLHLTVDIMDLVHAFEQGNLDHGWERKPNGDAMTSIMTRCNAMQAGIPCSQWASNPYRTGS
jgi:hypothetical protein